MIREFQSFMSKGVLLFAALVVVGCGGAPVADMLPQNAQPAQLVEQAYVLGPGDQLRIIVFGEPNLSGAFEVDGEGTVALPLVGQVHAGGQNLRDFERTVESVLQDGYLRDPRVSAEVTNFRPFYIIGEINNGGEFPFTHGMSVLNAIAIAGGYSYRADRRKVMITRATNGREAEFQASPSSTVMPGDVIRVPERFF